MNRTPLYKTAVILSALLSLASIVLIFPALLQGPADQGMAEGIPRVVIVLSAIYSSVGLVAAYGAWRGQKWGIWLTIVVRALDGLLALPGVLFAPTDIARVSAILSVLIGLFVIVVLLRRPNPALAASN
jgi:hypothetical protein